MTAAVLMKTSLALGQLGTGAAVHYATVGQMLGRPGFGAARSWAVIQLLLLASAAGAAIASTAFDLHTEHVAAQQVWRLSLLLEVAGLAAIAALLLALAHPNRGGGLPW